ncbi:MAG: fumarylacetoacetate hydrolase family protein [Pseudomonadota bacterium]|jgi:5-oxopent-3-ene-1,2,5-tricarboxylate decarboxylase/2-hydroxyhepta-2,4-diene-1,7-dioate isomerase|uniref:fumarylacetoacetate hydrolase family protein n=1 Tax=Burkholderiaceae TaxID=119060 RepID=UPI0010FA4CE0|nr:fumarylacetoacetate hydrolase family protein [Burkholderia sp. 4M9327F10]
MFSVNDHLLHVEGESVPRDADVQTVHRLLASGVACRPPVTGAVYGTLLNDQRALDALGDAMHAPPYQAPPRAPVLYVKPRNTLAGHGAQIEVPGPEGVQIGASLGIVIGRTATRVAEQNALDCIAGYTLVADLCIPHDSVYRPSVRFRARDGFCVIGPAVVARRHIGDPDRLEISVEVEGRPAMTANTATSVRKVARLLADVTEFMTLRAGDVITLGAPHDSPVACSGDRATVTLGNLPPLRIAFIAPDQQQGAAA